MDNIKVGHYLRDKYTGRICLVYSIRAKVCARTLEENYSSLIQREESYDGIKLTQSILYKLKFGSSFSSDPQEQDASKVFRLNDFNLHMPNENIEDFVDDNGDTIEYLHELQNLLDIDYSNLFNTSMNRNEFIKNLLN